MIDIGTILKHYKREDIQKEMIEHAKDKEVIARFEDKFSNRPDVLKYPRDILELAKQGATSFHASEELWENPLRLSLDMRKKDLDSLRIGWDLVIDVDCPYWEYSKLITHLIIKALKQHGVTSISCKFSGNKGFHIGIPFEAFPKKVGEKETRLYFPEGVRVIGDYLIDYINIYEKETDLTKLILNDKNTLDLIKKNNPDKDLFLILCAKCAKSGFSREAERRKRNFGCNKCGYVEQIDSDEKIRQCKKCGAIMRAIEGDDGTRVTKIQGRSASHDKEGICPSCGLTDIITKFNIRLILNIDSILISSRHLYRMPYSLHEKSGLCSIPIDPEKIMGFEKEMAKPENAKINFKFLDKKNVEGNNAKNFFDYVFHWHTELERDKELRTLHNGKVSKTKKEYETPKSALNEQFFPPCIKNILKGMVDGRKRSVFILINFLTSVGWEHDKIENFLREWNKRNNEELREVYFLGQLRYHKQQNKKILPPNCKNKMYYVDMRICSPDNLCSKIKNPVNYSIRKVKYKKE